MSRQRTLEQSAAHAMRRTGSNRHSQRMCGAASPACQMWHTDRQSGKRDSSCKSPRQRFSQGDRDCVQIRGVSRTSRDCRDSRSQADFSGVIFGSTSRWPTSTANLCPIEFDAAKSDSRPRMTILHNNAGGCKTSVEPNDNQFWRPLGLDLGGLSCKTIRTKRKIGPPYWMLSFSAQWTTYIRISRIKTTFRQDGQPDPPPDVRVVFPGILQSPGIGFVRTKSG